MSIKHRATASPFRPSMLALGLSAGLSLALLSACGGESEQEMLQAAKADLQKNEPKAAIIELKNLLLKNPGHAEGRFLFAETQLATGDLGGAEASYRKALEQGYAKDKVLPQLAQTLLRKGQAQKLIAEFTAERLQDVSDKAALADIKVSLSTAHLSLHETDAARSLLDEASALAPDLHAVQLAQARLLAQTHQVEPALAQLEGLLQKNPRDMEALLLRAQLLWRVKGDAPAATAAYRQALAQDAKSFDAHAALITLALEAHDVPAAKQQLAALKAAGAMPGRAQVLEAQVEYGAGNYKRVRELVDELRRNAPDNQVLLRLGALASLKLNDLNEAESLSAKAIELAPDNDLMRRLNAQVLLQLKRPADVIQVLTPLLDAQSKDAAAFGIAAEAALMQGDTKQSDEWFRHASQIKPDDQGLHVAMALADMAKGRTEAATAALTRLAAADTGTRVDLTLISAELQHRDATQALNAIDKLAKKIPQSPMPDQLRARAWLLKNELDKARQAYEASLKLDPQYLPSVLGLSALDLQAQKPDAAIGRLKDFLKTHPKNSPALLALAELSQKSGVPAAEVQRVLADAVQADPGNPRARLVQIEQLAGQGDNKGALNAAQSAVAALPSQPELLERLAMAQWSAGDSAQALSSFGKLSAMAPESPAGALGAAKLHAAEKNWAAAQADLAKAFSISPDAAPVFNTAIQLALQTQHPQDALVWARDRQSRLPQDAAGFLAEGRIDESQQQWDAALAVYRKLAAMPVPSDAAERLHSVLLGTQRQAEAQRFADGWQKQHPNDEDFALYLADRALASGDLSGAESRYQDVLKKRPDQILVLNNVAWIRLQRKEPGALAYAEKAVAHAPNVPNVLDTYALALAEDKQWDKALATQKRVVQLDPKGNDYRLNLARYLIQTGDKAQARAELDRLSKLGNAYVKQVEVAKLMKEAG